ncbi:HAMP domain-containing protein [Dactylosporangium sp. CS-047395]|uniref:sensor histidine kinase n=1 Tax=Dactylosporangium sp. CS-047395 TaxID=3239936 RepID=UPI003D94B23B
MQPRTRRTAGPPRRSVLREGFTRQVAILSLVFVVLVSTVLVTMLDAVARLDQQVRSARASQAALIGAGQLQSSVLELASSERGFTITHDPRFISSWQQARAAIPKQMAQLAELVSGDPAAEQARVRDLNQDIATYLTAMPVLDPGSNAPPLTSAALLSDQARLDAIHTQFAELVVVEVADAARQTAAANGDTVWARSVAAAGLAGSVLAVLTFAAYVQRRIVRPVRAVAGLADQLAGGDLSTRMPDHGPHEIGQLQRSFNAMAVSLERHRTDVGRLLAEQHALRRVATLVARTSPPDVVFSAVTEEVGRLLHADTTMLVRCEPECAETGGVGTVVAAWSEHEPPVPIGTRLPIPQAGAPADPASARLIAAAAVAVQAKPWGVLLALGADDRPRPAADRATDFADLAGLAISDIQSRADLANASIRIVEASDQGRRRVERDLHDGTQQRLLALLLNVRRLEENLAPGRPDVAGDLAAIHTELAGAIDELRKLSHGIHPAILTERGLGPALKTLARRAPLPVELKFNLPRRLPERVETSAYYVAAEALTNATKHAQATHVRVEATIEDRSLSLRIRDDGIGGADPTTGSGIRGLIDRVTALGGSIQVNSPANHGTRLIVTIPVDPPHQ